VTVGEALGSAPSIPGWRLQHVLDRMLKRAGVQVLRGTVATPENAVRRLKTVRVREGNTEQRLEAETFVLATGKFVGGGIVADGRLREAALDCPIWIEHAGETFELAEPLTLTNADRREDQPLLSAGVAVDSEGRAIDRNSDVVFDNVWTAGAVRRGHDAGSMGLGHAATEGWAAGERATS
jgi:glycerol-3-phosphate dehydrogenase subunit B